MYHEWLKSTEIQELTETEPCSLTEEYAYQKEWESNNQTTSKNALKFSFEIISLKNL